MASTEAINEELPTDRRSADIGIVCTQALEVRPLLKALDRVRKYKDDSLVFRGGFLKESIRVAIVEAGSGFARHRQAAQTLINEHHPVWVLAVGFSSSLTDQISSGDVCLANEIADTHGNTLPVKCSIPETKRVFVRKHVVCDQHPAAIADRQQLATSSEAAVADTASLAVAQVCAEVTNEKPAARFLSIRGVAGSASAELTPEAVEFLFCPDPKKRPTGLSGLWSRFRPNPETASLKALAEETAVNLNRFTLSTIEQLAEKLDRPTGLF